MIGKKADYLLYITQLLEGKNRYLEGIWLYATRILISSLVEKELIDNRDFDIIIMNAKEDDYIRITTPNKGEGRRISLTKYGREYLGQIANELIFASEIKHQIDKICELDEKVEYINRLKQEIKNVTEYIQNRKVPLPNVIFNARICSIEGEVQRAVLTSKEYQTKDEFSAKGTLVRNTLKKALDDVNMRNYFRLGHGNFVMIFHGDPENFSMIAKNNHFEILEDPQKVRFKNLQHFTDFVYEILSDHLTTKKGLVKIRYYKQFIDFSEKESIDVTINGTESKLSVFYGFNLKIDRIDQKRVILWIDPAYKQYLKLDKILEIKDYVTDIQILNEIKKVQTLPQRSQGKLVEINRKETVPNKIARYWKDKYNMELTKSKGMAKVQFNWHNEPFSYPIECLCKSRGWIEKELGSMEIKKPTLSPYQRFKRTNDFFDKIDEDISSKLCKISIHGRSFQNRDIEQNWKYKPAYKLNPPKLTFSEEIMEEKSTDPRAIFKFGPYSGGKELTISKIICPQSISKIDIERFLNAVKRTYDSNFGRLNYSLDGIRETYSQKILHEDNRRILEILTKKFELRNPKTENGKNLSILVDPNPDHIIHYYLKKIVNDYWEMPSQSLKEDTFTAIMRKDFPITRGFALQLYLKSLDHNEKPWVLRCPSDKRKAEETVHTVYCGVGFSRRIEDETQKKSVGIFAIGDPNGRITFQQHAALRWREYYFSRQLLNKIFSFIATKSDEIGEFTRVLLYKKGELKREEEQKVSQFISDLKKERFWKDKVIDVVTVKESMRRLFSKQNGKITNVPPGTVFKLNTREALLCSSGHPELPLTQGTIKPVHIRCDINGSDREIGDLVEEYYDRVFLNWMAHVTISKYPPELKISSNIAEILREVDIEKDFSYLVV